MRAFLIKRLLALIPTILFATLIVFIVIRLIPGDVIDQMVSQHDIGSQEVSRKSLEKALGLDVPIYVQYFRWMGQDIFTRGPGEFPVETDPGDGPGDGTIAGDL